MKVAFPNYTEFSQLFSQIEYCDSYPGFVSPKITLMPSKLIVSEFLRVETVHGARSALVKPTEDVLKFIGQTMLVLDRDMIYFEAIPQRDDTVLIVAKYNIIIGSRWLAYVDKWSIPPEVCYSQENPTSWVAHKGRQAIWETTTRAEMLKWLKEQGHEDAVEKSLRIKVIS